MDTVWPASCARRASAGAQGQRFRSGRTTAVGLDAMTRIHAHSSVFTIHDSLSDRDHALLCGTVFFGLKYFSPDL